MIVRQTLLAAAVAGITLTSGLASASLESEMNKLFGSITNVTDPSAVSGTQRGVIQGGSIYTRTPLTTINPVNLQMPRIDAGCGGIDMFGGSFSFINKEQYIQLLRSIAGNATGYAFKLALTTLSPMIGGIVEDLQKSIGALNAAALDSCNITQNLFAAAGATPESAANLGEKLRGGGGAVAAVATGLSSAVDSVGSLISKVNDPMSNLTPAGQNQMYATGAFGNTTWRLLNEGSGAINRWFEFGDTELANALMSYTGTILVVPPPPSSDSTMSTDGKVNPSIIGIRDLYEGNIDERGNQTRNLSLYSCQQYEDSDPANNRGAVCLPQPDPVTGQIPPLQVNQNAQLQGMLTRVNVLLLGAGVDGGIAGIFDGTTARDFNDQERALLSMENRLMATLQQIGNRSPLATRSFAQAIAVPVALALTEDLSSQVLNAVKTSAAQNSHITGSAAMAAEADKLAKQAQEFFIEQQKKLDTNASLIAIGENILKNAPPQKMPSNAPGAPTFGAGGETSPSP